MLFWGFRLFAWLVGFVQVLMRFFVCLFVVAVVLFFVCLFAAAAAVFSQTLFG